MLEVQNNDIELFEMIMISFNYQDPAEYLLIEPLKSSKAPTNYFTPNILRKSWSRLVVSVVHLDALAFPVAAT